MSWPSGLSFGLPLSKNVPLADSSSSMRKPSGVIVISMWLFNLSKFGTPLIAFFKLLLELLHVVVRNDGAARGADDVPAGFLGRAVRIAKIAADRILNFLAGVQQPQHDEQRHHGGHEIRIGDFPRAAMMAAVAAFFLDDDDRGFGGHEALSTLLSKPRRLSAGAGCLLLE